MLVHYGVKCTSMHGLDSRWSFESTITSPTMIKVACHIGFLRITMSSAYYIPTINIFWIVSKWCSVQWVAPCLFHSTWKKPLRATMIKVYILWAILQFSRTRVFSTQRIWHLRLILWIYTNGLILWWTCVIYDKFLYSDFFECSHWMKVVY